MPRGIAKSGFRAPKGTRKATLAALAASKASQQPLVIPKVQTSSVPEPDNVIEKRITDRFEILEFLVNGSITKDVRSLIVSGPAGLGKSFTVEQALKEHDPLADTYTITKGFIRATGLFKLLYDYKDEGQIIVFDDSDSIFFDDVCLNFLKGALDTTETRVISYLTEGELVSELSGEVIPKTFEYKGSVIFITNYDFDKMIDEGNKLAPHLSALMSRSHYIDLMMKSRRDYVVRIKQVCKSGMLRDAGCSAEAEADVLEYIEAHTADLRELSLRTALKLAQIVKLSADWKKLADNTMLKLSRA